MAVGRHALLQVIFLTQGWNLRPLHGQEDSSPLSHQGSPWQTEAALCQHIKESGATAFFH